MSSVPQSLDYSGERRVIRVATSTYVVIGIFMSLPLIVGFGIWVGQNDPRGALFVALAPLVFWYFCFQQVEISNGELTHRRPLFPAQRAQLSNITEVRTVWQRSYRRFVFLNGETSLCEFNPKLFSLDDLAFVLVAVRAYSPSVVFDNDTSGFLPARQIT
jgi:hypothetical protein